MSPDESSKFVDFNHYCPLCKYGNEPENSDPCWECLACPVNDNSEKPILFKKKEN